MARAPLPPDEQRKVVSGLQVGIFVAAIDSTLVSVALLTIARDLGGASLIAWVVAGYTVAATVATPVYGSLSDIHGRQRMMTIAIVIYLVAAIGCLFAQSMPQLLALRVLQGLGGGGLVVLSQSTIGDVVPPTERGRYQAWLSGTYALAALIGPVTGGYLTIWFGWRSVFAVTLPLALQAVAGNPPDQVALKMLMHALAVPFGAFFSGRMMPRTMRFRRNMVAGAVLGCVCAALLAWLRFESPVAVGAAMLGMGLGLGIALPPGVVAVQVAVAHARIGAVTALLGLARSLGSAMGLAILTSVLFSTIGVAGGSSAAMLVKRIGPADLTLVHGFTMVFVCVAVALALSALAAMQLPATPHRPAN